MFDFLFKKAPKVDKLEVLKNQYSIVKNLYSKETIAFERKQELSSLIEKYGYLPFSQTKAIEQLTLIWKNKLEKLANIIKHIALFLLKY